VAIRAMVSIQTRLSEVGSMNSQHTNVNFNAWFGKVAARTAGWVGSPWAFALALASVVIWGVLGPYYKYSDTWQLVINTATTVITFLIVFLIQNTQNRDARALHLKLDEIIRSINSAHNEMINIEKLSDRELEDLAKRYEHFSEAWSRRHKARKPSEQAS
jgi:low affinity Fe/Cu permease